MDIHLFASDKVLLRTSHSLPHAAAADDRGLKISKPDDAIFKLEEVPMGVIQGESLLTVSSLFSSSILFPFFCAVHIGGEI